MDALALIIERLTRFEPLLLANQRSWDRYNEAELSKWACTVRDQARPLYAYVLQPQPDPRSRR